MKKLLVSILALSLFVPQVAFARAVPARPIQTLNQQVQDLELQCNELDSRITELESRPTFDNTFQYIRIGALAGPKQNKVGNVIVGNATAYAPACDEGQGDQSTIVGSGAAYKWCQGSNNVVMGNGAALRATTIWRSGLTGLCVACSSPDIRFSEIHGEDAFSETTEPILNLTAMGWEVGKYGHSNNSVILGKRAGYRETRDNVLHIANNEHESLLYGEFDTRKVKVNGSLEVDTIIVNNVEYTLSVVDGTLHLEPIE